MTGAPDPKPVRRKGNRLRRIIDPQAIARAKVRWPNCAACGRWAGRDSGHHVLPKDRGGDDVEANIIVLCGSGTSLCHGAHHGNPYTSAPIEGPHERRDAEWVNRRVGEHLLELRLDAIEYVLVKLGHRAGEVFLTDTYRIDPLALAGLL